MSNEARQAEATGDGTADVEFRGHTFTVSRNYDEMPVAFIEAVEEGRAVGTVKGALGPRQWRTVQAMNLNMRELSELADEVAVAMGFASAGESSASSG